MKEGSTLKGEKEPGGRKRAMKGEKHLEGRKRTMVGKKEP